MEWEDYEDLLTDDEIVLAREISDKLGVSFEQAEELVLRRGADEGVMPDA